MPLKQQILCLLAALFILAGSFECRSGDDDNDLDNGTAAAAATQAAPPRAA